MEYKSGLLGLRQTAVGHTAIVDQLLRGGYRVVSDNTRIYLSNVRDHLSRVVREVDLCRDATNGARDLYLSMLSNRTNESMRVLAIVATVMLPLTLIASIYGMNLKYLPGAENPHSFWLVSAFMVFVAVFMIVLFRWKKWL